MPKRRSRSRNSPKPRAPARQGRRDYLTPIANPLSRLPRPIQNFDNRTFDFSQTTLPRAPITRYGARTSLKTTVKKGKSLNEIFSPIAPTRDVLVCVRRSRRREVLFAKRRAGKLHRTRRVRRNASSSIRC